MEHRATDKHETGSSWLTAAMQLAIHTRDLVPLQGPVGDLWVGRLASLAGGADDAQVSKSNEPIDPAPDKGLRALLGDQPREGDADRGTSAIVPISMAWLPAEEYAEWPARWPDLSDSPLMVDEEGGGFVDHAEYSWRMERQLRNMANAGASRLLIAPMRSAEFDRWVADHDRGERNPSQLRANYAAKLGQDPSRTIAWPPGRNETCWCGSGLKYKKCCAAFTPRDSRRTS